MINHPLPHSSPLDRHSVWHNNIMELPKDSYISDWVGLTADWTTSLDKKYTHVFIPEPLHVALQKRRLSHGDCYVALDIKVKVGLHVSDRRQLQMM